LHLIRITYLYRVRRSPWILYPRPYLAGRER
jgi:hypothetical protein